MSLLFADPGDPLLDHLDPDLIPFDDDSDLEMAVDASLSVNPSAKQAAREAAAAGQGAPGAPAPAAAAPPPAAPPAPDGAPSSAGD